MIWLKYDILPSGKEAMNMRRFYALVLVMSMLLCLCPVAEAATKVGIEDANYFSRIFKKKTGFSPTEYINMYGLS